MGGVRFALGQAFCAMGISAAPGPLYRATRLSLVPTPALSLTSARLNSHAWRRMRIAWGTLGAAAEVAGSPVTAVAATLNRQSLRAQLRVRLAWRTLGAAAKVAGSPMLAVIAFECLGQLSVPTDLQTHLPGSSECMHLLDHPGCVN